jgi:hypothetical protein
MTTEPKPKPGHDITDPVTIASVIVRDHLDTVIQRHGSVKGDAVSAAVLTLATALLQHLPGEAKQARADRA